MEIDIEKDKGIYWLLVLKHISIKKDIIFHIFCIYRKFNFKVNVCYPYQLVSSSLNRIFYLPIYAMTFSDLFDIIIAKYNSKMKKMKTLEDYQLGVFYTHQKDRKMNIYGCVHIKRKYYQNTLLIDFLQEESEIYFEETFI